MAITFSGLQYQQYDTVTWVYGAAITATTTAMPGVAQVGDIALVISDDEGVSSVTNFTTLLNRTSSQTDWTGVNTYTYIYRIFYKVLVSGDIGSNITTNTAAGKLVILRRNVAPITTMTVDTNTDNFTINTKTDALDTTVACSVSVTPFIGYASGLSVLFTGGDSITPSITYPADYTISSTRFYLQNRTYSSPKNPVAASKSGTSSSAAVGHAFIYFN